MKFNGKALSLLLENLNHLICEDNLLTREERQSLVLAVVAVAGLKARAEASEEERTVKKKVVKEKKERVVDRRFPNAGTPWSDEDENLMQSILEPIPDEEIDNHVLWLAQKLGRTPYSVACKIVQGGRRPQKWKIYYQELSDKIRQSGKNITEYTTEHIQN